MARKVFRSRGHAHILGLAPSGELLNQASRNTPKVSTASHSVNSVPHHGFFLYIILRLAAMRSQLTRSVFRRLLSNEGLIFHCPSRTALLSRHSHRHASPYVIRPSARRTLFGFSQKPPRQQKEPSLAPGLKPMLDLSLMDKIQARPPPAKDLVKAWRTFFGHKSSKPEGFNSIQAQHVLRVFKHLQKLDSQDEDCRLNVEDLRLPIRALYKLPEDNGDMHAELAKLLHTEWLKHPVEDESRRQSDFRLLISVLTGTGHTREAKELIEAHTFGPEWHRHEKVTTRWCWDLVLRGYAKENNEAELLEILEYIQKRGLSVYSFKTQLIMTKFYAARDDVEATKMWYSKPVVYSTDVKGSISPEPETLAIVLQFCIRNNELDWCRTIFRDVLETDPNKATWDIVLQWAAGVMGKGVEDVERMMKVMIRRSASVNGKDSVEPDIVTINGLVELAMSLNDSYLAERYIALGEKFGIKPNANTFILQMRYRADANDLRGAQEAYDLLQAEEVQNDEDLPAINKFLRALCASKNDNYTRITSIICDLEERNKRLEADTVCALTNMYLHRDELEEMIDVLQTQSYHYTVEERSRIINIMLQFATNPQINTVRAWESYSIMRQVFDETPTEQRTQMMNEFFSRNRCDMACHVFGHMRQHSVLARRPILETYVQCFEGIAKCEDRESLDMVHNMLKMDSSIEPNTKLYNSLMLAYTACDDADRALDFWDDITNTDEGPSYKSLEIVFWACGRKPFGDRKARDIWNKMRRMEIEVTGKVFAAYIGALSGQAKFEEARDMLEVMEKDLSLKLDVLTYVIPHFSFQDGITDSIQ
ncbi:hypothetical protein ONS95_002931 [Cadophora gregata]|uniref:uncharacterized protein n=1 Tax=Cadophora gregata TaxID=51156 RepID=UPI0026DBC1DD|nr:uncharacterized protein ONS95_002931 [Cadophora gregata]KAK0108109.1 hypothetical protein ONS95_002931 [Cadophora gregata]